MDGREGAGAVRVRGLRSSSARARLRGAAVALVMASGVVATLATSPAPDPPCPTPTPTPSVELSDVYGAQDVDTSPQPGSRWSPKDAHFEVGPFEGEVTEVSVVSCILEHLDRHGRAPLDVGLEITDDGSGPGLESFLRSALVVDAHERAWPLSDLGVEEGVRTRINGLPVREVTLRFALPLDVPEPLVLRLPDLDGRDDPDGYPTEFLLSNYPAPTPDPERTLPTVPPWQRRP